MPVSINNTALTFNDATTQTTSGVTSIGTGTGISSTGGKTPTLTNTGVTSVAAGSGISVSASTGGVTITNTSTATGTVTSVATGNGLQGGTITSTGTLSVACPTWNTVGSYAIALEKCPSTVGSNYSSINYRSGFDGECGLQGGGSTLSGTWKLMGAGSGSNCLWCRVS